MQSDVCQLLQVPSFQRAAHSILEMAGMVDLISTTSPPPPFPFPLIEGLQGSDLVGTWWECSPLSSRMGEWGHLRLCHQSGIVNS